MAILAAGFFAILGVTSAKAQNDAENGGNTTTAVTNTELTTSDLEIINNKINALAKSSVVVTTEHNYLDLYAHEVEMLYLK